ncbi:hypothetical protein ZHAS_00015331 [Anopheles sinensis]|uniref:Uncharacterized protein n=1 Tax=Anopheles sinensis TaxID=74873 RepID=A0A084WAQ6_ANOSI|nr:hypothetical protein ZHAS_00015331 [Anopheles sinensis]
MINFVANDILLLRSGLQQEGMPLQPDKHIQVLVLEKDKEPIAYQIGLRPLAKTPAEWRLTSFESWPDDWVFIVVW